MRVRIAAVALVALSLSGCVAEPPPGPSPDAISAHRAEILEKTWANTGLTGEAPTAETQVASTEMEWIEAISGCLAEGGVMASGWSFGSDEGYALLEQSGGGVDDPAAQRVFYVCVATYAAPNETDAVLSDAQLNYIYDYYVSTLVPCMIMNGFTPTTAPTRVEFLALAGQWNPYYSVDVGLGPVQYEQIERICGAERPELY